MPQGRTHENRRWYTHISHLTQFMHPPETYKSEIGSQPKMCQVQIGGYVSLLAPGKTDCTACHPKRLQRIYLQIVYFTTHTHDRRKSIRKMKHRKEKKIKGRKERKHTEVKKRKRKSKKRKDKKNIFRQHKKRKQGKEKRRKQVILADHTN